MKRWFWLSLACILAISLIAGANNLSRNSNSAQISKISTARSLPVANKVEAAKNAPVNVNKPFDLNPSLVQKGQTGSNAMFALPHNPAPLVNDVETVVLTEGFEGGVLPAGWTDYPGTKPWLFNAGLLGSPNPGAPYAGSYAACFNVYSYSTGTIDTLISPSMNLSTLSGNYVFSFWGWDGADPYDYVDSAYFILCENGVNTTYLGRLPITDSWTLTSFQFASTSTNAQIKIVGYSDYGYTDPYIDDIKVEEFVNMGRCCSGNPHTPTCANLTQAACGTAGGTWSYGLTCALNPCPATPLNDQCFEAQAITGAYPQTITGTDINATIDCPDSLGWNGVWYSINLPYAANNVRIDFCPTTTAAIQNIGTTLATSCTCTNLIRRTSISWPTCNSTLTEPVINWYNIPGPTTVYFPCYVAPAMAFAFDIDVQPYIAPTADFTVTAPGSWTGNTCTSANDCPSIRVGREHIYAVTLPYDSIWIFSTCNTDTLYDTWLGLGIAVCDTSLGYNDDFCGLRSEITRRLTAGTYYVTVEGYYADSCFAYTLDINPSSVPPPPNDLCESVTPVSLPVNTTRTFTGTNAGALNDCSLLSYPQVWEAFTTTETLNITVDYCGTVGYTNYFVNLIVGCPCGSALGYYSYDFTTCVDSAITIKFHGVPPGTYYLPVLYSPVGSANPASGPYTIHVIGVTPPPPPPNLCATSLYSNGAATGYATASQCDNIYPFAAGTADDFILPGTGNVTIDTVIAYFGFWNGATDPSGITGMVVTIYADNAGYPAGQPIDGDPGCAHEALVPGGIITSEVIPSGSFSYGELTTGVFQMAVPITPVILTAGTTYWLEVAPILSFSGYGQCGWIYTDAITGIGAMQIFALLGATAYAPLDPAVDMAFCLKGPSAPSCVYLLGDVNSDDLVRGGDVTFAVRYFKGLGAVPPDSCHDAAVPTPSHWLYVSGDVNGDCKFMGSDVTRLVSYFKGISVLVNCPLFPHPLLKPASNDKIEISK